MVILLVFLRSCGPQVAWVCGLSVACLWPECVSRQWPKCVGYLWHECVGAGDVSVWFACGLSAS